MNTETTIANFMIWCQATHGAETGMRHIPDSYFMQLAKEWLEFRGKEPSTFGEEVFRKGYYFEVMIAESETVKIIACLNTSTVLMYRIEWKDTEDTSYWHNKAEYSLPDAIQAFREKRGIE